jgi:hypothetical protein
MFWLPDLRINTGKYSASFSFYVVSSFVETISTENEIGGLFQYKQYVQPGERGSIVVKVLRYKPEGRESDTR